MWRSLPRQKPLEYLLRITRIARTPIRRQLDKPPLELYRTPEAHKAGWLRFQEYAALVEEITIDPFVASVSRPARLLEDTFWCQLSEAVGGVPILPHLKVATLRSKGSRYPMDAGVLRLLNPSTICELNITFPNASERELQWVKRALREFLPSTKTIRVLSMEAQDLTPMLNLMSLPRSHPCLRSLKLNRGAYVGLNELRSLSNLPHLECLDVNLRSFWEPSEPPITLSALSSLTLSDTHIGYLNILLTRLEAPRLQSFSFSESHGDSSRMSQDIPSDLRTLLAKYPTLTSFEWTSIQTYASWRGHDSEGKRKCDVPLAELVAPLVAHRAMRRFSIEFRGPIVPYTPADFRAFAEAWPDLEAFSLDGGLADSSWEHRECYADVETVFAFARNCPGLRTLVLPSVEKFGSGALRELVRSPPTARHWLREFCVHYVVGSRWAQSKERYEVFMAQLRGLLVEVFPCVTLDLDGRQSPPRY